MDLLAVGPKSRKVVLYKNIFYRNTIWLSEFKVLFYFFIFFLNFWCLVITDGE